MNARNSLSFPSYATKEAIIKKKTRYVFNMRGLSEGSYLESWRVGNILSTHKNASKKLNFIFLRNELNPEATLKPSYVVFSDRST